MLRKIDPLLQALAITIMFSIGAGTGYVFQKSQLDARQARIDEQKVFITDQQKTESLQRDLLRQQGVQIRYLLLIVSKQTKTSKGLNEIQYVLSKKKPTAVKLPPVVQKTIIQKTVIVPKVRTVTKTVIKLVPIVAPAPRRTHPPDPIL